MGAHLRVGSTRVWGWKQTGSVDSICAPEPAHVSPYRVTVLLLILWVCPEASTVLSLHYPSALDPSEIKLPAWTQHWGLGALQPCSSSLCLFPDLALFCVAPQETEKIIAELNETWEEKLRRTEAIRMERWVVGTQGQRSSALQPWLWQTHPLSPGDPTSCHCGPTDLIR